MTSAATDPITWPITWPIIWPDATRRTAFETWLAGFAAAYGLRTETLALGPASTGADAGSSRCLHILGRDASYRVLDAPPPLPDARSVRHVAEQALAAGLHAPQVLQSDAAQGFLLLTDLGDSPYLQALQQATPEGADRLMRAALQALVRFQQGVTAQALPPLDATRLQNELALFPEWCVAREFGISWTAKEQAVWDRSCHLLVDAALAQPVVAVQAGWSPRQLLLLPGEAAPGPGLADLAGAAAGPISYDLVSLLRDAGISWEEPQELDWAVRWWQQARRAGLPVDADFGEFWRQLEWMGLQRHLHLMGRFCRLKHRDGAPSLAGDLPRFLGYAGKVALRYGPLKPLLRLLEPLSGARVTAGFTF